MKSMSANPLDQLKRHPAYIGLGVAEVVLATPLAVMAYSNISPTVGIGAGAIAIGLPCAGLVYWLFKTGNGETPSKIAAPIPQQIPTRPVVQPSEVHAWKIDDHFHVPPNTYPSQYLYREAFEAMRPGRVVGPNADQIIQVGYDMKEWVEKQCFLICQAYPGTDKNGLTDRFYELAFNWIKQGLMYDAQTIAVVVPLVEKYLHSSFSKGL
jgi:hypothetical protein